jgi:predicted  nucleic acid-binding Zn-ribbon protein
MSLEKEIADLKRTIENKQKFINRILEEKKEMSKEITALIKENQKLRSPAHLKTELAKVRKIKKTIQEMGD